MDKDRSIAIDAGEKFDAIFGEEEVVEEITLKTAEKENNKENKTNRFNNISLTQQLKSIILSLEWEITDDIIKQYSEILYKLQDKFKDDVIALGIIRILQFLGKYIQIKKNEADSRVGKMLSNISEKLGWVLDSDPPEGEKRTVFADIVEQYKNWVKTIKDFSETRYDDIQGLPQERKAQPLSASPLLPQDAIDAIIEEIRSVIRDEFKKLISEWKIAQQMN